LMPDLIPLHEQLLDEVEMRVRNAVNTALIDSFGNLHVDPAWFLDFRTLVGNRLALLARHDTGVYMRNLIAIKRVENDAIE
jgi:hypothetical protein